MTSTLFWHACDQDHDDRLPRNSKGSSKYGNHDDIGNDTKIIIILQMGLKMPSSS